MADKDNHFTLSSHADVVSAAMNPEVFSSQVSRHLAIPNSLDGDAHRAFRVVIDQYLSHRRVLDQVQQVRSCARLLVSELARGKSVEIVQGIGYLFAVRTQSEWLGWPEDLEEELLRWVLDNQVATRSGDYEQTAKVAGQFDRIINQLISERRPELLAGRSPWDVTSELIADRTLGRSLTNDEIVSILRNWTAGDLGSIATSIGVIVYFLAQHPVIQEELRNLASQESWGDFENAIEEILRIDDPFVSNRRITTCPVDISGEHIPEGSIVHLNWTAANRDRSVFEDPDEYSPDKNQKNNLVFGAGPHFCPGRELTLMELSCLIGELLRETSNIELAKDVTPIRETTPFGGWASIQVVLH